MSRRLMSIAASRGGVPGSWLRNDKVHRAVIRGVGRGGDSAQALELEVHLHRGGVVVYPEEASLLRAQAGGCQRSLEADYASLDARRRSGSCSVQRVREHVVVVRGQR